jgi:AAA+ ATPase superfamily predicted ATPase
MLVGREKESKILTSALQTKQSELIAVYGRRRVGKTYLIRNIYHDTLILECIGMHKASLKQQLEQFKNAIQNLTGTSIPVETPKNWSQAFILLQKILENISATEKKKVIFFDELPWLATRNQVF